jgi:hypothetical protein
MTEGDARGLARRAAKEAFREALDYSGEDEPPLSTSDGRAIRLGYRTMQTTPRDLSSISQERANEASYRLWNTNPLAKSLIEIMVDYVLGDGATIQAEDPAVDEALRAFWDDPVNDLDGGGAEAMVRELSLFGEQLILAFVRDGADLGVVADGRLRLGPVDPNMIAGIVCHPDNRHDVLAVRLKTDAGQLSGGKLFKVIRAEDAGGVEQGARDLEAYRALVVRVEQAQEAGFGARLTESALRRHEVDRRLKAGREWQLRERAGGTAVLEPAGELLTDAEFAGECFLFQVNKISTGIRGRSDLLPLIDWLDRYDQLFFDVAEHAQLLNMFVWDLQVEGGTEAAAEPEKNLIHQAQKIRGAKPNSIYAHNEKVKLEPKNPDLKTGDSETILRALRVFISGGMRVPEHWLAEGGYTNRATAREMGEPTHRMLRRRQAFVERMLTRICQYQIDVLVALGHLDADIPETDQDGKETGETTPAREAFTVVLPDVNVSDTRAASQALVNVSNAVFRLHAIGLLPDRPALELVAAMAQMLGVDIDVDKGLEALQGDKAAASSLADLLKGMDKDELDDEQGVDVGTEDEAEPSPDGRPAPVQEE